MALTELRSEIEGMIEANDLHGLLLKTGEIHGHHCVGSALGVMAAQSAMKELGIKENTGMEHVIALVETNSCFSDGVQIVTGCTFGNNALIYQDFGKSAVTLLKRNGEGVRVSIRPGAGKIIENLDLESRERYKKFLEDRETLSEEEKRIMELNEKLCFRIFTLEKYSILKTERVKMDIPAEYSRILESAFCAMCGEKVMATKTVERDGETLCIPCSDANYMQLDWSGIRRIDKGE
jgi:formylmethanofuran dehydrogenase subunit E